MTKSINHFEIEISSENDDEANELNLHDTFELKKHKKKRRAKKIIIYFINYYFSNNFFYSYSLFCFLS